VNLPISDSQIAKIIGVNYWHPAQNVLLTMGTWKKRNMPGRKPFKLKL
jgi:hypothetical protein